MIHHWHLDPLWIQHVVQFRGLHIPPPVCLLVHVDPTLNPPSRILRGGMVPGHVPVVCMHPVPLQGLIHITVAHRMVPQVDLSVHLHEKGNSWAPVAHVLASPHALVPLLLRHSRRLQVYLFIQCSTIDRLILLIGVPAPHLMHVDRRGIALLGQLVPGLEV